MDKDPTFCIIQSIRPEPYADIEFSNLVHKLKSEWQQLGHQKVAGKLVDVDGQATRDPIKRSGPFD